MTITTTVYKSKTFPDGKVFLLQSFSNWICFFFEKRGWDKSPSLLIVFGLSSKTQWLSGLYYADFISFYSPTQLCGGGTTKSNSNELPISVPLSPIITIYLLRHPTILGSWLGCFLLPWPCLVYHHHVHRRLEPIL